MDMDTLRERVSPEYHGKLDCIMRMCNAPYAVANGLELISMNPSSTRMGKKVRPEDLNSLGIVHGAVSFGLMDHTSAVAAEVLGEGCGQSCNIIYHKPCTGPYIEAEAKLINSSRTLAVYEVRVYQDGDMKVSAVCTNYKFNRQVTK